jgi:PKD repeat protein
MRKIYFLLACLFTQFSIAFAKSPDVANFTFSVDAPSFNVAFANTSTLGNEPGNRIAFWSFGDGTNQTTDALHGTQHHYSTAGTYTVCLKIYRYRSNIDSVVSAEVCKTVVIESLCGADFERLPGASANNPLRVEFRALPLSSNNKKPSKICWTFGDGRDTCINYPENYTGVYTVNHTYLHSDQYEVCVKINYYGGCEARKCKLILVFVPDSCNAGFIRQPGASANNPLRTEFRALPWHSNNKKPSKICWTFGDGRDTCINYSDGYNGAYTVTHTYANAGEYEVCVKINYFGGCEKRVCKRIRVPEHHEPHLIISPNPVHSTLHAIYYSPAAGQANIRILNSSNLQVRGYSRAVVAGINTWDFDLGDLLPGIYTFLVQTSGQTARVMFIKI